MRGGAEALLPAVLCGPCSVRNRTHAFDMQGLQLWHCLPDSGLIFKFSRKPLRSQEKVNPLFKSTASLCSPPSPLIEIRTSAVKPRISFLASNKGLLWSATLAARPGLQRSPLDHAVKLSQGSGRFPSAKEAVQRHMPRVFR